MCVKCERKSKRLGLPKGKYGKVKFWAHQLGGPSRTAPLFSDKRLNYGVEAHLSKIQKARTRKRKDEPSHAKMTRLMFEIGSENKA